MVQRAVMALSGGMDSTSLLVRLLANGVKVSCVSYHYGQKHDIEVERATKNIEYLRSKGYEVGQKIVDLTGAMSLFESALINDEKSIPEGHYEEHRIPSFQRL
ncbi:MAG: 7-cyano-7-deazaguanine synthase [Candidatus Poseidoniaceae archaeon]|nr:7-cyano-7-deazaguanine synthase [Candidatus Poseidoniaceae archaeon]